MSDGKIDGSFTIKKGQGLSKALVDELGLTKDEVKKIGGSVWNKIFEIAENKDSFKDKKEWAKDDILYVNDKFDFTQDAFKQIVDYINEKIGRKIEIAQGEQGAGNTNSTSPTPVDPPTDEEIAKADELAKQAKANNNALKADLGYTKPFFLNSITPENLPAMVKDDPEVWVNLQEQLSRAELKDLCEKFVKTPQVLPELETIEDCINFLKAYVEANPAQEITDEQRVAREQANAQAKLEQAKATDKERLAVTVAKGYTNKELLFNQNVNYADELNNDIAEYINNNKAVMAKSLLNAKSRKIVAFAFAANEDNARAVIAEMGKTERVNLMKKLDATFTGNDVEAEQIIQKAKEIKDADSKEIENLKASDAKAQEVTNQTLDIMVNLAHGEYEVKKLKDGYLIVNKEDQTGIIVKTNAFNRINYFKSFTGYHLKEDGKYYYTPLMEYNNKDNKAKFNTNTNNSDENGSANFDDTKTQSWIKLVNYLRENFESNLK